MKKLFILTFGLCFITNLIAGEIYINRVKLNQNELSALQATYGNVQSGRYWYDSIAGIWGYENGPTEGKAIPNIYFRGKLPADISGRGTDIYINGREIHFKEKKYLESIYGLGNVKSGRYWINHLGTGGYEGRAAFFKIPHLTKKTPFSPFSTRDLVGGSVVGNSYIGSSGISVSCGSDGGCIY